MIMKSNVNISMTVHVYYNNLISDLMQTKTIKKNTLNVIMHV